ncbi:MAG: acyl-CoA dehydrogenase family protein [Candidatus Njordarchaeales archaeon]
MLKNQDVCALFNNLREKVEQYSGLIDLENKYPEELLNTLKENGVLSVTLPQDVGGKNWNILETVLFLRLIGSISPALGLSLMVHCQVCGILKSAMDRFKDLLGKISQEGVICGLGITEIGGGSDISKIETVAKLEDDSLIINGEKSFVTNAVYADIFAILTKLPKNDWGIIIVEKNDSVEVAPSLKLVGMRGSGISKVFFRNTKIPKENLVASGKDALKLLFTVINFGRIATAAISIGVVDRLLNEALKWITTRQVFQKYLSENEYVQQRIAELASRAETAWLATIRAAREMDDGKDAKYLAAISKLEASKVAMDTALYIMHLFASHAYVQGSIIERFYRDAKALEIMEGTSEVQRILIFKEILKRYEKNQSILSLTHYA